jgi:magnesium chelatase family protein
MLVTVKSATLRGIDAVEIDVEVDAAHGGLPGEALVGLPDTVIRESKNRIRSALKNSGFKYPLKFYTINLAPAEIPKEGPLFDVPIAVGILQATEQFPLKEKTLFVGELSLNGDIKPIRGAISICHAAAQLGYTHLVLPYDNASECSLIEAITLVPVKNMQDIQHFLENRYTFPNIAPKTAETHPITHPDFKEVMGQSAAKRALEIAAAGGHNVLFIGPPGSGKTMLLKRLPGIMPELTMDECIETTKIHSIALKSGLKHVFNTQRPFRTPHHSVSYAGLIGGGSNPMPGEISLAHHGILFLDELPEFPRNVLEVLRQPLEDKKITISRANASIEYPADCLFVAAMNPCPCGYYGDTKTSCTCHKEQIKKYWKKISGPILDRIDLILTVPRLNKTDLFHTPSDNDAYASTSIKARVLKARETQTCRQNTTNGNLTAGDIQTVCPITPDIQEVLASAIDKGLLSGRSYTKVVKVARTIADLEHSDAIKLGHVMEAIQYRKNAVDG